MEKTVFYALRPKAGTEPQPPQIGDVICDRFGSSTVIDLATASEMAHQFDDEGGKISHWYLVAENGRDYGQWMPHYADEDAVRVPASEYFAKHNKKRS